MKKTLLLFQWLLTAVVVVAVHGPFLQIPCLLLLWWVSFGGLQRKELIVFVLVNVVFVVSDLGAIANGFFHFTHPDFLGLPAWEFLMWGFFLLHAHRMLPVRAPAFPEAKLIALAIAFTSLFATVSDRALLLALTSAVLALTLLLYHRKGDIIYCAYLMLMGAAFEYLGLHFDLWAYPHENYAAAFLQFIVMWGGAGVYFHHLVGGWLARKPLAFSAYKAQHETLDVLLKADYERAKLALHNEQAKFAEVSFANVETRARARGLGLNYDFFTDYARCLARSGNQRKAIDRYRYALDLATRPSERAAVRLQLARNYRGLAQPESARYELERAFSELGLALPSESVLQLLAITARCFFGAALDSSGALDSVIFRKLLRDLYGEFALLAAERKNPRSAAHCHLILRQLPAEADGGGELTERSEKFRQGVLR